MKPRWHLMAGLTVGVASLFFSQSVPFLRVELFGVEFSVFTLCVAVSVLLDVDHIVDFWVNKGWVFRNLEDVFRKGRMFDIFHSVEIAVFLPFLSILLPFLVFPAISYACHIAMDAFGNNVSWQAYFYVFRFGRWTKNHPSPSVLAQ